MAPPSAWAVSIVVTLVGAYLLRNTVRGLRQAWNARSTPLSEIVDVNPDDGWVKISGTVRPVEDETFDALTTDREAVLRVTALEKRTKTRSHETGTWTLKETTVEAVPFAVDDGTGTAYVDVPANSIPTNYRLLAPGHHSNSTTFMLDTTETRVKGGRQRSTVDDAFDHELDEDSNYRLREGIVEPGDTAYVGGYTERPEVWSDVDVVISGEETPRRMLVADKPESEAESGSLILAVVSFVVALVVFGGGLYALGLSFGLLPL